MCWRLGTNFTYKSLQSICVCVFYKKRSAKNFFLHIITRDRNFSHVVFDRQYFDNNFDTTWRFNSLLFQKSLCINENKAVFLHTNSTGNKNTMTGLVNCKKTTRHHAHLSLGAKSRKTNDAKSRKWPKTSISAFFLQFWGQISRNCKFCEKYVSFKLKVIFSTNFRPKTKKIVRAVFEKNIKVSDFGLIWRRFREYLQIKNFFEKSGSVTFLPL